MTRRQIIVPVAALRAAPRADAGLENECLWGETFIIDHSENGFAFGRLDHDGYEGWVEMSCLGGLPAATATVQVPMSHVTSTSDIKSPGLFTLSVGSRISGETTVNGVVNGVMKIVIDGGVGFLPARHVRPEGEIATDWVAVAESLVGAPYKWGGRSAFGLDCSALVQVALAAAGIKVPRDSGPQHAIGAPVLGIDDLRRGDLVFWKGHVGIMQNGHDLLHANAHHMAVACEPLALASDRIARIAGPITALRRL